VIEVRGLGKRFGETTALDDVSFKVEKGEVAGFLGLNGAGKTTTLRILATYLTPDAGRAVVAGRDPVDDPIGVRRRLGYLPEHPPLDLDHTVGEYLRFCSDLRGVARRKRKAATDAALESCGLTKVRGRRIGNLSKGYRQRVGLAQALVHEPEVLILDEPTIGLDPQQIREIRSLIRSLARARTVLLSTHILSEVTVTCSRAIVIQRGRVVADDTLESLSGGSGLEETFLRLTADDAVGPPDGGGAG
jgi:ABC-2 type transport system ATP-binding protein